MDYKRAADILGWMSLICVMVLIASMAQWIGDYGFESWIAALFFCVGVDFYAIYLYYF